MVQGLVHLVGRQEESEPSAGDEVLDMVKLGKEIKLTTADGR
jgi:hypothetical protein